MKYVAAIAAGTLFGVLIGGAVFMLRIYIGSDGTEFAW